MDTSLRNQEIRRKRAAGMSLAEIGEEYGISRQRVKQLCPDGIQVDQEAADAALRRAMQYAENIIKARQAMSDNAALRADAIREALQAGMSQAAVARALGIGTTAVNDILRSY